MKKGRKSGRRALHPELYQSIPPEVLAAEAWSLDVAPAVWQEDRRGAGAAVALLAGPNGALLLRRYRRGVAPARLEAIHAGVAHVVRRGFARFPAFLETESGKTLIHHSGEWYDLSEWVPGQTIAAEDLTEEQLANLGAAVARLHLAGLDAPGPAVRFDWLSGSALRALRLAWDPVARRKDAWRSPENLAAFFQAPELRSTEAAADATVSRLLVLAGRALDWLNRTDADLTVLASEPPTLTHGDLRPGHLRWEGADVGAMVDLDTLALRPPLGDLAALCANFGLWDPGRCQSLLAGYRRHREIGSAASAALPALGVRHALGIIREYLRDWLDPALRASAEPSLAGQIERGCTQLERIIGDGACETLPPSPVSPP